MNVIVLNHWGSDKYVPNTEAGIGHRAIPLSTFHLQDKCINVVEVRCKTLSHQEIHQDSQQIILHNELDLKQIISHNHHAPSNLLA